MGATDDQSETCNYIVVLDNLIVIFGLNEQN